MDEEGRKHIFLDRIEYIKGISDSMGKLKYLDMDSIERRRR